MAGILIGRWYFVYADPVGSGYITRVMKTVTAVLLCFSLAAAFLSGEPVIPMPGFEAPLFSLEDKDLLVASVTEEGWTSAGRVYSRKMVFDDRGHL